MYRAVVVGIDNSGKTSLVNSLGNVPGIDTIRLTQNPDSALQTLAEFGERHNLRSLTGFAYLLQLFPYFSKVSTRKSGILVSDRDPMIDAVCYSQAYLPKKIARGIRTPLKSFLGRFFSNADLVFYLGVSPEVSHQRNNKQAQLHDGVEHLTRLKESFDEEVRSLEKNGVPVVRIDTDRKPLEEITGEVRHHLKNRYGFPPVQLTPNDCLPNRISTFYNGRSYTQVPADHKGNGRLPFPRV